MPSCPVSLREATLRVAGLAWLLLRAMLRGACAGMGTPFADLLMPWTLVFWMNAVILLLQELPDEAQPFVLALASAPAILYREFSPRLLRKVLELFCFLHFVIAAPAGVPALLGTALGVWALSYAPEKVQRIAYNLLMVFFWAGTSQEEGKEILAPAVAVLTLETMIALWRGRGGAR